MNKFFMNCKLTHKASNHNSKLCEGEKWVFLPHSDFERLKANPYQEHKAIAEAYLFLYNRTAIEYIRNGMKRCRKKESAFILASQNLEDFLQPEIRELTKPLFSIPTHHFLFNPGNIKAEEFIDMLQFEPAEYKLIRFPERGICSWSKHQSIRRCCLDRLAEDKA